MKANNLFGRSFGRWTVTGQFVTDGKKRRWPCRCTCGNEKLILSDSLVAGRSLSCGCLRVEGILDRVTTHGMTHTPLYRIWGGMISRCSNPRVKCYDSYAGRGIGVCDEWKSFENFYRDMSDGYQIGLTLERKDNNKGYEPNNCVWATRAEQSRNRRPSSEWVRKKNDKKPNPYPLNRWCVPS